MGRFATLEEPKQKNRFSKEILEDSRFSQEAIDVNEPLTEDFGLQPIADPDEPPQVQIEEPQERPGVISRGFKQFVNKFFTEPARTMLSEGGIGDIDTALRLAESGELPEPSKGPQKFTLRDIGNAIRQSNKLSLEARQETRKAVAEIVPGFDVPESETLKEKAVDVAASVTAFVTRLAVTRKVLGAQPDDFVGSIVTWETENIATGGTPGAGAAMRLALGGVDSIPATTLVGKTAKLGAGSSLFGGLTAAAGGDWEDIAISALIPLGFKAWNAAARGVAKGRTKRAIKNLRTQGKDFGINLDNVPDQALGTIIEAGKKAKFWNNLNKKGKITAEVYEQRLSEIQDSVKPIFEAIGKQQPTKPTEKPAKPPEVGITQPPQIPLTQPKPTPKAKTTFKPTTVTPPPGFEKPLVSKPGKVRGVLDPQNPPEAKGRSISAIKMDDGTVLFDTEAVIHSDMLKSMDIKPEEIADGGFIVDGKYVSGSADVPGIARQAKAKKKVEEKRQAQPPAAKPKQAKDAIAKLEPSKEAPKGTEAQVEKRPTDLLGDPVLQGGASGKQSEFLNREDFKTTQEKERINAGQDIEGQEEFKVQAQAAETDEVILRERREIKQIPQGKRTLKQILRIDEIEDELVIRNADEFPEVDISPKSRNAETKKVREQIKGHGIYQSELDAIGKGPDLSGQFAVDKKEIQDIKGRFEGRPEVLNKFVVKEGGTRWDAVAQDLEIESFDDFLDSVELFVESQTTKKGGINEIALANALNSQDPSIELFALKHDMLKSGFNAAEINKELEFAAENLGIDRQFVEPELISLEELTDVTKKQAILSELDKTIKKTQGKKVLTDIEPEQDATRKAEILAFKTKQPVFVIERQGISSVTKKEPRKGEFIKITAPAAGELKGKTEKLFAGLTPEQIKEGNLLKQRINIAQKKKGLTKREFSDLKLKHGGSRRLAGTRPRNIEQLKAVLAAVEKARPKHIGHRTVITPKTERQIKSLYENLLKAEQMTQDAFQGILEKETGGKLPEYKDAKHFVTQAEGREVLARMHDEAEIVGITEPVNRAVQKNAVIAQAVKGTGRKGGKDPWRTKSMRYYAQKLGYQADAPIYDVFYALVSANQSSSRDRHKLMKHLETLPSFTKIATSEKALQRVSDYIASQSYHKNKPEMPTDITDAETRLAKEIQQIFKAYELKARLGKFWQHKDDLSGMPQYLKYKKEIDQALNIYDTQGVDKLIEYLKTQDWGIIRSGYEPAESVVFKTNTHKMPAQAVGKSHIKVRSIEYSKSDRNILQRLESYMRQMDMIAMLQPKIKAFVRIMDDNYTNFTNPPRVKEAIEIFLDNLKKTNFENGVAEEIFRKIYSQAITVRVLADPIKPLRNLLQNVAFSEDRRDFLDPRNKKLTPEDREYLETFVKQDKVMMTDWAYTGEEPFNMWVIGKFRFGINKLTKWVQRRTLYPASDRLNRLMSFSAKINRVRRAFKGYTEKTTSPELKKMMETARFSDMQSAEQKMTLGLLAKDGVDSMARYTAKVHTDNTHFLYAREQRSPAEQTKMGRMIFNLWLFRRAALEKAALQLQKVFRGGSYKDKLRAARVLVFLIGMSAVINVLWKKITGQKYGSYDYINFLEINAGGLELASVQKIEDVVNGMVGAVTGDDKALAALAISIPASADYLIPFYDLGLRGLEATLGAKNMDRKVLRQIRMMIDKEYEIRGSAYEMERSLIEKFQYTFGGAGVDRKDKKKPDDSGDDIFD